MSTSWQEVALGDVCNIQIGKTPARATSAYWGPGHSWLSIADMRQGRLISRTSEQITDLAVHECNCKLAPAGTPLLSFKLSIGKVGIAAIPLYTNEAIAHLLIRDDSKLDPVYLCWALESLDLRGSTDRAAMGKTLNKKSLNEIKIPLPPLDEQRRIAAILNKADEVRTKRKASLETLETLSQAIFIEMFGDPVTNPMGWPLISFGEACPSHLGKMLDQKQQTGLLPKKYLRNANVRWLSFDLADVAEMDFLESELAKYRLQPGDVIICEGGEPGRAAVWKGEIEECYFQKALHRARPRQDIAHSDFIVHLLLFLARSGSLSDHVTSATIAHLTGEKLKRIVIPMPPVGLQQEFSKKIKTCDRQKEIGESSFKKLNLLFSSLQQRAFQGAL